ncbi:hypothetical protein SAMD00019534_062740 [Acytostelium subglobosum LB1]|uniref:hypothetical protein n=1 Tax=Acytostelium subglobosum LB1 TaxID=1410327 RepID=UPI0006448A9F|nr:hypothetical protein SAMD00019534_062740 [Acytostelium subglobosum LB1]GAM23099.1 hypothetical protein SAMD00019534_062740 [Acytostelium subglobosum LB1]|eukprot:XP_012754326.1 hypothetical protein SAMD00019534_062740 [Acytostelium subglobosum LB1]
MSDEYYKTFGLKPVNKDYLDKQELYKLYLQPKKDKGLNMPHYQVFETGLKQQADLLFLPDDDGFKYALVVVDLGNRLTDAEPLKNISSAAVKQAFETIYKRGILVMPKQIQTDPGGEFEGETKKYFKDKGVFLRYGVPGRHRMQAMVEARNKTLGTVLMKRMTAQEMLTGETSKHWVEDLPKVIKAMNERFKVDPKKKKPESN